MAQMNRETRSDRRNAKKKYTKRFLSVVAVSSVVISGFAYAQNSLAENGIDNKEISLALSTQKIDRDTVKIQLDNFAPLVKAIQLNVAIDGNAKFKEDSIKWLVTAGDIKQNNRQLENIKTHVKMADGNKTMQIFIVSDEPLNNVGANLEICEIDVEKVPLAKSSSYRIDSNVVDDIAYSYVLNDTNKQVSGIDMANLSEEDLTINSAPVISLKPSTSIVDGNIVISKGDKFDATSYIVVNDEEDGEISVDKVSVDKVIKTNQVGSYTITYTVADSEGEIGTLVQTVIVEDTKEENVSNPVITVDKTGMEGDNLTFTAGDDVNLFDYITAVDYLDRPIAVEIVGDYDLNKAGTYTITVIAKDRLNNKTEEKITIVVKAKPDNGEGNPGDDEQDNPGNGEENPGGGEQEKPGDIEIVIPSDVVNKGGEATKESPLVLETTKVTALGEFISEAKRDYKVILLDKKLLDNNNVEYSIRLEEKSLFARLFSTEKVYYVKLTVPNTEEFNNELAELEIEDTAAPILKYDGKLNITVENGAEFKMPVVTAIDNFDSNVTVKSVIKDESGKVVDKIDTTKAGKYTITYTAEDNSGNISEELRIVVEVKDAISTNPGGGTQNPGGGTQNPGGGAQNPGGGAQNPGGGAQNPGGGAQNPGGGTQNPGDGAQNPGGGAQNPSDGTQNPEEEQTPNNGQQITQKPEVSVKPENSGTSNDNTNIDSNTDNKNNVNKIPQTGQGIFYGITVAIAAVVAGIGVYLLRKKK